MIPAPGRERQVWSIQQVPDRPGLHREILSQKIKTKFGAGEMVQRLIALTAFQRARIWFPAHTLGLPSTYNSAPGVCRALWPPAGAVLMPARRELKIRGGWRTL